MPQAQMRNLLAQYGKLGVAVHVALSTLSLTGCYAAVKNNAPVEECLSWVGLRAEGTEAIATGSTMFTAWAIHKMIFPIRAPLTLAITPLAARLLRVAPTPWAWHASRVWLRV
eukprot:CAMPEP_0194527290 /NCGR_PEP_ID=MMETSP0253-20130528/63344_1 /TAXON_ID=2966 /ORGANISM="Noctiluca scintillans" /LENGTH=112 /DNA_ID=CAMNT_0039372211 /DNA_START=1 /DNA_END=340 /DNA_ORIENTATION=+